MPTGARETVSKFFKVLGPGVTLSVELRGSVFNVDKTMRDWLGTLADHLQSAPEAEDLGAK